MVISTPANQTEEKPKEDEVSKNDGIHVLAVDDCRIDLKIIERVLTKLSFKVTSVQSAEAALKVLGYNEESCNCETPSVNMIITDYCMPGMTGYDLLKKVKTTRCLKEIPVVIISSERVPERVTTCLAEGAEDFLFKPVKATDIIKLKGKLTNPSGTPELADQSERHVTVHGSSNASINIELLPRSLSKRKRRESSPVGGRSHDRTLSKCTN